MTKHCYKELPEGYEKIFEVDAKKTKTAVLMNVFALVLTIIMAAILILIVFKNNFHIVIGTDLLIIMLVLLVSLVLYMVLHELTHGILYKIMTKEKLKFGLTFSCAYCGVPNLYVDKKTALLALLAPFTVFSIVFLVPLIVFATTGNDLMSLFFILMFSIHFGGCIGDLYDTYLLLFKFKGEIYVKDDGAKQEFFQKNK
ncbi:MAG: DUF3267 domain-containing protein [Bacillales bacterium]|nr:DUF3267 domain-containing protein [Bacillales bacterium]